MPLYNMKDFPGGSDSKVPVCNAADLGLFPGLGRSPGEGNGTPLQYSCLENPMDRGAWWATVHEFAKSWTQLRDSTFFLSHYEKVVCNLCILKSNLSPSLGIP